MDDGADVGTHAVDGEVHSDLAGDVAGTFDEIAVVIDDDHVGATQEGFAAAGGRCEDEPVIEADREVSRGAGCVAKAMNPPAEAHELPTEIGLLGA